MSGAITRIFSDIHYGDRASQVSHLAQLHPLLSEIDALVLNGDTLDTRQGPRPAFTATCRTEVSEFAQRSGVPVTFLTGNHDPDISPQHCSELADGRVFVVHGDVLFDDIVPWGRDARRIRHEIESLVGKMPSSLRLQTNLDDQLRIWRQVAAAIPQRHQSERHPLKYAFHFAVDTIWPPTRFLSILGAWKTEANRAAELTRYHRPKARFILLGHTHRPAIRRFADGRIVINTGSFTAPFGGYAVDISETFLRVRRIERRSNDFRAGAVVAEFPIAKA